VLDEGRDMKKLYGHEPSIWRAAHHSEKRRVAFRYALRVWSLLYCAVKDSRTRFAVKGVGVNNATGNTGGAAGEGISSLISREPESYCGFSLRLIQRRKGKT
jgi:hypothetical protein